MRRDWTHKNNVGRCDHCGKFERRGGGLVLPPIGLMDIDYPGYYNYSLCEKCGASVADGRLTLDYWKAWIDKQEAKKAQA